MSAAHWLFRQAGRLPGVRGWLQRRLRHSAGRIVDNNLLDQQGETNLQQLNALLPLTSEHFETHLAIARRYRQQGDLQQASAIHQSLLESLSLSSGQRARARLELARDFLAAGELSRAEWQLQTLLEICQELQQPALQALLRIYEREREWEKAIGIARIMGLEQPAVRTAAGHYHCEWAEQHWRRGESAQALQLAQQALQVDPQCVRASLLLADWRQADCDAAIRHLLLVVAQDADFIGEALPPLLTLARRSHGLDRLEHWLREQLPGQGAARRDALVSCLAEVVRERHGELAASQLLQQELEQHPSLLLMARLLERAGPLDCAADLRHSLLMALDSLQSGHAPYACRQCGFQARRLHWQCPACHGWSVIRRRD